jgi:hypothetical protein
MQPGAIFILSDVRHKRQKRHNSASTAEAFPAFRDLKPELGSSASLIASGQSGQSVGGL